MEKVFGFFAPFFIYIFIFILNAILPGRWVTGYVSKPGSSEKLRYRLNGLLVLFVVLLTWIILCYTDVMDWVISNQMVLTCRSNYFRSDLFICYRFALPSR
jgi:hypothetical protein